MAGWQFRVFSHNNLQVQKETPKCAYVRAGLYTILESHPVETNWIRTTPYLVEEEVNTEYAEYIIFGNVTVGAGGAKTGVFWAGRDGQAVVTSADLTFLSSLYLRNANGIDYNPATAKALGSWLGKATTTNMAYALSAPLVAMELNVRHNYVNGSALVYAPGLVIYGTVGLNSAGFINVNDLMAAAAAEIQAHGMTAIDSPDRTRQEALKRALDDANDNKSFAQSVAGPLSFE